MYVCMYVCVYVCIYGSVYLCKENLRSGSDSSERDLCYSWFNSRFY